MGMGVVEDLFAGGGEMKALMRSLDWSQTLLGSVSEWAPSLKTALNIILTSRYPMFIWWGAEYANLYNDAYRPLLGASKHPQFLGQSAKDCWAEVWDVVGSLADSVLTTGQPTGSEDLLLLMDRNGYLEETYFTFSYSPVRDESGGVGGVLCAVSETTGRIIGERRLRTLRELAAKTAEAKTVEQACHIATTTLSINPYDIPFALFYRVEPDGKQAYLAGTTGIEAGTVASPEQVDLFEESESNGSGEAFRWNLARVNRTGKAEIVSELPTPCGGLPKGACSEKPSEALVIPIAQLGKAQRRGLLVVGISPRREFDDDYQGFFELIASNVAIAIANAEAVEEAWRWLPEEDTGMPLQNSPPLCVSPTPSQTIRILLVDDNADARDYVRRLLSRDYEVEAVNDGLVALDAVQRHLPDLVLTDVMMPGLNGLELLRSLRNNPATQSIPIILLSAHAGEESRLEGVEAGADDYLVKPLCAHELLARVRTNLELARLRREAICYQEQLRVEAQAAQAQVSSILESITDAFVAFDREWRYTYVNEYATRLLRKKREELLGKHVWTEVFPQLVGTQSYWEFQRAVAEQIPIVFEKFSQPIGGWVEVNVYPSPDGLAVYFRDITHRKQAEQALRESEERFRQLTENIGTVFFMSEGFNEASPGQIAYVSLAYERIWGRSCESLYQDTRSWFEAVHPDDRERIGQALPGIARAEFDVEFRIIRPDGEIRWVHDRVFPIYNERGEIYRTAGIVEDITQRKQIEEALQQQEAQLRLITDTVPVLISFVDAQQRYRFNNRTYEEWFGHPATEVYGKPIREVLGELAYEAVLPYVEQVLAGQEITFESEIPYQEGGIRYVSATYVPRFDHQGNVEGYVGLVSDISERKQAEIALQKSEERLRLAQRAAGAGLWNWDIVADRVTWSEEYYQLYGIDSATTPSYENWIASIWEPDREQVNRATREALTHRTNLNVEFRIFHPTQGLRWLVAIGQTFYEANGKPMRMTGIALDITNRKQAEIALRLSEQQARLAIQVGRLGTWRYNINTDLVELDKRMREIWGEPDDAGANSLPRVMQRIHPDDREWVAIAIGAALNPSSSGTYEIDYRIVWDDGTQRWVSANGQVQFEGEGELRQPIDFFGTAIDITERKQAEEVLRQSEERLRLAMEGAQMSTWDVDLITGKAIGSDQHFTMLGYEPMPTGEASEAMWCSRIHPEDRERVAQEWQQSRQEHRLYRAEYRVVRADTQQIAWVAALGSFVYSQDGEALRSIGVLFDITDRKLAEVALRESESRFRNIADHSPIMIWMSAPDGAGVWFNQQWFEFTGQTLLEALGSGWLAAVHPEDAQSIETTCLQAHQRHEPVRLEYRLRRQDGEYRWVFDSAVPRFDDTGVYLGYIGSIIDITDRKQAEAEREELLVREQVAREQAETANRIKDEFLAVLSHELRSPLNPILGWAKLLQSRTLDEQKTKHALATIERNALLQTQLIEDLLDVSRILRGKLVLNTAPVNLASTIEAALETVRLAADAKSIQIQRVLDSNVGQVKGESARLQQVIWNLLSNAVKFTPSGGTIEIRLEQIKTYAQVQVRDTGKGITREFLPHVFEYFRQEDGTTTRKFGGLGLGLAIVRHLVELHGGTVWAESPGEGLGATFTVRLPLMPVSTPTPQDNPPATPVAHLTGLRILVVDDQPDIRDIVAFILEQAGAGVSVAAGAPEAFNLIEQSLPDVLICDIGMPNMDGYMLMRLLRTRPAEQGGKILAIALSAYAGEVDQQQALAAGFQQHIPKPVEPEELVRAITRLVEHPQWT